MAEIYKVTKIEERRMRREDGGEWLRLEGRERRERG